MNRIVNTDNFGGDYPDEKFVLWSIPEKYAQRIADALNESGGENAMRYYKVVDNDYKLQPGFGEEMSDEKKPLDVSAIRARSVVPSASDCGFGIFEAADFIAHARTDVPALCDGIEALRAELAAIHTRVTDIADNLCGLQPVSPVLDLLDAIEKSYNEQRIASAQRIAVLETAAKAAARLWLWAKNAGWSGAAQQDVDDTKTALVAVGELDPKRSPF